jgi:hypothetical protein
MPGLVKMMYEPDLVFGNSNVPSALTGTETIGEEVMDVRTPAMLTLIPVLERRLSVDRKTVAAVNPELLGFVVIFTITAPGNGRGGGASRP